MVKSRLEQVTEAAKIQSSYSKQKSDYIKQLKNYEANEQEEQRKKQERENANVWQRVGSTIADVFTEMGGGLIKSVEGIVDTIAGVSGFMSEKVFGNDNRDVFEDFIKRDFTQEIYYSGEDRVTNLSYLNDTKVTKDIIRGVGQQLPTIIAVLATPVTGGASLAAVPFTTAGTVLSAGGTGMEEALNDGADYYKAAGYGLTQMAIEGVAEGVTAGLGKGVSALSGVSGKTVAKSFGKTILEEGVQEGLEEGVSAVLNPLAKEIYKEQDLKETYSDMTFWMDAGKQALVGAVVGGIAGGAGDVSRVMMAGGRVNFSVEQSLAEIEALEKKEQNLWKNGKLDNIQESKIENQRKVELENISNLLKSLDAQKRSELINKYNLADLFDENGFIKSEAIDDSLTMNRKPSATDNKEAFSPGLRNETLIYAPTKNTISDAANTTKKVLLTLNSQARIVIADDISSNAFYDTSSQVYYISNTAKELDIARSIAGHEFTHSLEGTKEYTKMAEYIAKHTPNFKELVEEKLNLYSEVNKSLKQGESGELVAQYEAETEVVADQIGKLISNPESLQRVVNQNNSLAHRLVQWVKDVIAKLTKRGVQGEYYNYMRNVERMLNDAMKHSVGGVKLSEIANVFNDRLAKQGGNSEIVANTSQSGYNEGNRHLLNNYKRIEGLDEKEIPLKLQDAIINYLLYNEEKKINDLTKKINKMEEFIGNNQNLPKEFINISKKSLEDLINERQKYQNRRDLVLSKDAIRQTSHDDFRRIQSILQKEINGNKAAIALLDAVINHYKLYTRTMVSGMDIDVIDDSILPGVCHELIKENATMGINTHYFINDPHNISGDGDLFGFYVPSTKSIYLRISSLFPEFGYNNRHERIHHYSLHNAEIYARLKRDLYSLMNEQERQKLYYAYFDEYYDIYKIDPKYRVLRNNERIWEEVFAQVYAGHEVLARQKEVDIATDRFEKEVIKYYNLKSNIRFSLNNQIDTVWGEGYSTEDVNIDEYNVINFQESSSIERFEQLLKDISGAVKQNLSLSQTTKTRVDLFNLLKQQENRVYSKLGEINDAFNQVKEEYTKNKDININQEFIKALGYNGLVSKNNTADSVIYDLSMKKRNLLDFSTERAQERRDKAIKLFGETDNPANAGWLLADGRFVDYNRSSENIFNKSENFVLDYNDHTQIEDVYDSKRGYDAIDSFMAEGNIRLMPEAGGIELRNKPTTSQIGALKKYIDALIDKQGITVDLRKPNTTENVLPNYVYYESTQTANTIINDINSFYNNDGKMPRTIEGARWSITDNLGNELTKEQQEYFKDSKVRDAQGNLLVVYHGTRSNNDFTEFDKKHISKWNAFGDGFYFTDDYERAVFYGRTNLYKTYINIENPFYTNNKKQIGMLLDKLNIKREDVENFAKANYLGGSDLFLLRHYIDGSEYIGEKINVNMTEAIKELGFDGIISFGFDNNEYVVFESNQIKLISNKEPSLNNDIRFSLKDGEGDYKYSKGQIAKYVAEHSKLKAYSRSDAEKIVNTIVADQLSYGSKYGELSGKTKKQAIDTLWHALNTNNEGFRAKAALDIADFIINNAIMEDIYADKQNESDMFIIGELKEYLHNVDLSGIKGEIKYTYDKDNSPYLLWGARKGTKGIAPDKIALELQERGLYIDALNEGEIFIEMDKMYRDSVKNLKRESKKKLSELMSKEELHDLQQSIAKEVMIGYDTTGYKTRFAQTIEKYTNKISELKKAIIDLKAYNKAKNNTISTIERLRDEFVKNKPAGWKTPQQVVDFVKKIAKVETWRNNISHTAREHLRDLQLQIDSVMDETQQKIYPYREILQEIAMGKGELSTDELITLDNILRQFAWQLRNYDQVEFEGKTQSNTELAEQGVKESKQAKNILKSGSNVLIKFKNKVYTNPYDRLAEMGLYRENSIAMRLYRDMLQGDRRRADLLKQTNDLFNTFFNKNKTYLKDLQKQITIGTGDNKLTLTKRQALSIYCTSLREQGRNHLFNQSYDSGVIHLLDNKLSTQGKTLEAFSKGVDVIINESMISEIEKSLTPSDKGYLEIIDKFFNKISKESKKEVDQKLYGVTNIESGYYFPIKVSKDKIYTEAGQNNTDINQYILEMGMNKSVKPNAQNKIVIDGIDNIVATHLQNISLYYGYAIPLTAYNRIMNKQVDSEGRDATSNMRAEIQKIDADFEGYMDRLWQDIQGIRKADKGFISSLLSKIRWAGANSALGANPKVLVTQTLSLAAAVSEFNPKYVTKGMAHFFGEKEKLELAKYSSLMWERMQIGHSTDVTEIRQIGKEIEGKVGNITAKATKFLNDFTTKPISWMDSNVIQSLWFAAQYEVADTKGKGYEFGTEANKIEAGKRLDEVVFRTQQTSDPLGRSEWMRSKNEFVKFARMFTGDALQLTGRLISSVNKYNIAKKMLKSGDSALVEQANKMMASAKTGVTKASSAFLLNQAMLLAIALAFKWIKGKDDDEEWGEIAKKEVIANLMGLIPFGGDIYDKLSGYEPTNMAYTALSNTVDVVKDLYDGVSGLIKGEYTSDVKRNATIRKSVLSVSRLLGIPAQNLESYMKGIIGKASPETREEYEALFKTKSNISYLNKIQKATEAGDEELAETYINLMFNSKTGKIKDDLVMDQTRELIELGYDVIPKAVGTSITYDGIQYTLTRKQHEKFIEIYSQSNESIKKLVNLYQFKNLDDAAKAKAMKFIYDYYYNLGVQEIIGEDIDSKMMLFAEAIPVEQLAIAISQAQLYTSDKDSKGNVLSGSKKRKVQAFVQSLNLTAVQKYMIMGYLGYSNENGASQVKAYINSLNLSQTQQNELFKMSGYDNQEVQKSVNPSRLQQRKAFYQRRT